MAIGQADKQRQSNQAVIVSRFNNAYRKLGLRCVCAPAVKNPFSIRIGILTVLLWTGCALAQTQTQTSQPQSPESDLTARILQTYADIAAQSYRDTLVTLQDLHQAIQQLAADPDEQHHRAAQQAWLKARLVYGQTEVYRFYGGPVDDERGLEGRINAWPLDEAYLDYVLDFDGETLISNGLINDPEREISKAAIIAANEHDGEKNISMGFHAIEFLLWGQDIYPDSAGRRDYRDYATAQHAERRSAYLLLISELLIENIRQLTHDWSIDVNDNYRQRFLSDPQSMDNIFKGMQVLAGFELAGERLEVALATFDQEDEHSCFSDNTHIDILKNIQGIENVFNGHYVPAEGEPIKGAGAGEWLKSIDPDAYQHAQSALQQAGNLADKLKPPFDQAIQDPEQRQLLERLVSHLRVFSRVLRQVQQTALPSQAAG